MVAFQVRALMSGGPQPLGAGWTAAETAELGQYLVIDEKLIRDMYNPPGSRSLLAKRNLFPVLICSVKFC